MRLLTSLGALSLALLPALAVAQLGIEVTKAADCTRKTEVGDKISVHYRGTLLADGTEFDSSYNRGKPFEFTLGQGQVIEGWDKGLLGMCIGEGRKLTIPPAMGYGNQQNGPIPAGSTLIFETELLGIAGVEAPQVPPSRPTIVKPIPAQSTEKAEEKPTPSSAPSSIPTPTPEPSEDGPAEVSSIVEVPASSIVPATAKPTAATQDSPLETEDDGECHLLGDFALIVQGLLGLLAVSSLVYKRWRESPRRPLKIWFFDVSKQVFGSVLLHMANILMSMLSSGDLEAKIKAAAKAGDDSGEKPNPCSFYLLNLAIDTTIGIPILVLLLKVLHAAFLRTPLAKPPESIRSGNYGHPPRATWWLKQSIIYFLGLFGMKLCVFFLFKLLPWIAWVGDWALRWTEGNEAIQITFVMFIFPLIMNALQYWIIDGFIKETPQGDGHYGAVAGEESDDEGDDEWLERHRRGRHSGEEDSDVEDREPLKEANPTAVPIRTDYDPETDGTHGGSSSEGERLNKGGKERRL